MSATALTLFTDSATRLWQYCRQLKYRATADSELQCMLLCSGLLIIIRTNLGSGEPANSFCKHCEDYLGDRFSPLLLLLFALFLRGWHPADDDQCYMWFMVIPFSHWCLATVCASWSVFSICLRSLFVPKHVSSVPGLVEGEADCVKFEMYT